MAVDLVVRGGTVVDGTGAPARCADVAVHDGRVVAVGDDLDGEPRGIEHVLVNGVAITEHGESRVHTMTERPGRLLRADA